MASVRKLDPKDPKSPWVVEYTHPETGKRKRSTPKSGLKKDADALRRKIEAEIERGEHVAFSDSATIADVSEAYMRHMEDRLRVGSLRRTTVVSNLSTITGCIIPALGRVRLCDLSIEQVSRFYETMIRTRGHKPNTARVRVKTLRLIEEFGRGKGYTGRLVVPDALKGLPRAGKPRLREFTVPQVEMLLRTAAEPKNPHKKGKYRPYAAYEVIVNIAAYCGLRIGEILGLGRAHIDLVKRRLYVRQAVNRFAEVGPPKTESGIRDVPLPERVATLLAAWLDRWYIENPQDLVFCTQTGGPMTAPNFFVCGWRPLLERAGLADTDDFHHFHGLRGFTISWMIENGIPPATVSKLVGHSNLTTTLAIYTRTVRELDAFQDDFDRIAGLLKSPMRTVSATETRLLPVSS